MQQGGDKRSEAEARILAGQSDEEIAKRLSLSAESVFWFEAAFFQVRDRLASRDWVILKTIGPGIWVGSPDVWSVWKAVAYFGGVAAMDSLITVTTANRPTLVNELLRDSVELLLLILKLPPETPLSQLAELYAQVRRHEATQHFTTVATLVADQSMRLLDEALTEPAETTPKEAATSSVA
jgi:hypothetical protein